MDPVAIEVEAAAKTGIVAQLADDAITGVSMRTFWLDDEESEDEEELAYPSILLQTAPGISPNGKSTQYEIEQAVRISTHKNKDRKRQTLRAIYKSVRGAIDDRDFAPDFIAIGSARVYQGVYPIQGSVGITAEINENFCELILKWMVCG